MPLAARQLTSRLIAAAGYAGWVLLVDELELIAQYSFKSRARAYAELARSTGRLRGQRCPGLVSLFAITQDFATLVLHQRNDLEADPWSASRQPLKTRPSSAMTADGSEVGMRMIERDRGAAQGPPRQIDRLDRRAGRRLHSTAYDWQAPGTGERATSTEYASVRSPLDQRVGPGTALP